MNPKEKGNRYERLISKELSLWFSEGVRDDLFYKTHGSGSRHTCRLKLNVDTLSQDGDIMYMHPSAKIINDNFVFELKHYKDIVMWSLLTGVNQGIVKFWNETKSKSDKGIILIVRQNHKPDLLISDSKMFHILNKQKIYPVIINNFEGDRKFIYYFETFKQSSPTKLVRDLETGGSICNESDIRLPSICSTRT